MAAVALCKQVRQFVTRDNMHFVTVSKSSFSDGRFIYTLKSESNLGAHVSIGIFCYKSNRRACYF